MAQGASYYFVGQTISLSGPISGTTGTFTGNVTVGGTLGVTGATTIAALSATSGTFSTTLGVTGASTFSSGTFSTTLGVTGAFTGTSGAFSTTLGVTGASTFTSGAFSTTLSVTGVATHAAAIAFSQATPVINATGATAPNLLGFQNNGTTVSNVDDGGYLVPVIGDPSTFYYANDFIDPVPIATYAQNGNNATNGMGAAYAQTSTIGTVSCSTSSTTAGGYLCTGEQIGIVKSATLTYQWRFIFLLPALSVSTNRYTAVVGGMLLAGTANNANAGPFTGPYISFTDNVNSGNWVMGSAVVNTRTTGNSSVAAVAGWHNLTITLANAVYTYVLDGVTLGTVTDSNMTTSVTANQGATMGGIMIIPDGSNYTTARLLALDRCDFYMTGLTR